MSLANIYLDSIQKRFLTYRQLGEKAMAQLSDEELHWQPEGQPNSIYLIVKHISGNMLSRWTDFLTTDGEKPWRNRDTEFEDDRATREQMMALWNRAWQCLQDAIGSLQPEDLEKTVYIRSEPHSVIDAINRQLAHIPYHVGQIVYIGKMLRGDAWQSLSIPKGKSQDFNREMLRSHGQS